MVLMPAVETEDVLDMIDSTHQVGGSADGQESRDALFGKLFGYMAVVQGNRLTKKDGPLAARLVKSAVELSQQKSFLPEACSKVICQILDVMGPTGVEKHCLSPLQPLINVSPRQCTAAGLAVILHLEHKKLVKDVTAALPLWVGIQTPIMQVWLLLWPFFLPAA